MISFNSSFFKPNQSMPTLCQPFSLRILLMPNGRGSLEFSHHAKHSFPFPLATFSHGKTLLGTAKHLLEAEFLVKGQDPAYQLCWWL
ncbi:MAG TPA: hypothetical protein VKR83_13170, partial [Ktedonobacteraceae bacterium]|nr:hypothetical protein [Ktedonobacteraceae bacterium]